MKPTISKESERIAKQNRLKNSNGKSGGQKIHERLYNEAERKEKEWMENMTGSDYKPSQTVDLRQQK